MSTRLGMGGDRCFNIYESSRIYNDIVMNKQNIAVEDNYSYRKYLQEKGPEAYFIPKDAACNPPGFTAKADSN
jgi:hypothetical protein